MQKLLFFFNNRLGEYLHRGGATLPSQARCSWMGPPDPLQSFHPASNPHQQVPWGGSESGLPGADGQAWWLAQVSEILGAPW